MGEHLFGDTDPGGGGGVIGDPYYMRHDGTKYEFMGTAGLSYVYADDSIVRAVFRIASIPGNSSGKTMVDRVVVTFPSHSVAVELSAVTVDGTAIESSTSSLPFGDGSAWWHTGMDGEARVDISYGGWRVAVIQDPGTDPSIHPSDSPLRDVLHLGLFIDAYPSGGTMTGLMTNSGASIDPADYLAN